MNYSVLIFQCRIYIIDRSLKSICFFTIERSKTILDTFMNSLMKHVNSDAIRIANICCKNITIHVAVANILWIVFKARKGYLKHCSLTYFFCFCRNHQCLSVNMTIIIVEFVGNQIIRLFLNNIHFWH